MPKWWTINIPEFLPMLRSGSGAGPMDGGCILQVIDFLDRGGWTDNPVCVHRSLRGVAISANDQATDSERQELYLLLPRLMGTAKAGTRYDIQNTSEPPLSNQMEGYFEEWQGFDECGMATNNPNSIECLIAMLDEFDRITKPTADDAPRIGQSKWDELLRVDKMERIRVPV